MKDKYKKIFVKINCDILWWHKPDGNVYITMPYGITPKSKCKYCGRDIKQDGQGNWY